MVAKYMWIQVKAAGSNINIHYQNEVIVARTTQIETIV